MSPKIENIMHRLRFSHVTWVSAAPAFNISHNSITCSLKLSIRTNMYKAMLHILAFLLSQSGYILLLLDLHFQLWQHVTCNCYKCATGINESVNALGRLYNLPVHLSGVLLAFSRSSVGL